MVKNIKKKAPSRVRYDQAHPTVSCRVSTEVYKKLRAVMNEEGKSFADVLKIGLGILEAQAKEEAQVRREASAEGYKKGYAEAQRLYKVTYPCIICGQPLMVMSTQEKEAIKQYMLEHKWGHKECHERNR